MIKLMGRNYLQFYAQKFCLSKLVMYSYNRTAAGKIREECTVITVKPVLNGHSKIDKTKIL